MIPRATIHGWLLILASLVLGLLLWLGGREVWYRVQGKPVPALEWPEPGHRAHRKGARR